MYNMYQAFVLLIIHHKQSKAALSMVINQGEKQFQRNLDLKYNTLVSITLEASLNEIECPIFEHCCCAC